MNALLQRLKELDSATFEELCFQIWSEKLPGAAIRRVEGKAGDKGTDLFAGVLAKRPAIWQCKFFKDGIKDVQKKQVKHSLKTALKSFDPALWTLCVPINLDINAHCWFQKLIRAHSSKLKIELFDASMIVKEMIFRRPMMNAFFPGAALDVEGIKSMLLGTGGYSNEQLGAFADETVEQYVERLRAKEPRYDYRVSYLSGNSGIAGVTGAAVTVPQDTVMSMWNGNRRLDLLVRDVEALRRDPPTVTLELSAEGVEKIQEGLRSGKPIGLSQGELIGFKSSFDFLRSPEQLAQPYEMLLTPKSPIARLSFRVSFGSGVERVVYDLIEFDATARQLDMAGNGLVVELTSASQHVPFQVHLVLGLDGTGCGFEMGTRFSGCDILEAQKFFRAMRALAASGELDLFELKTGKSIGPIHVEFTSVSEDREPFEKLTDDLAEVAKAFGQQLIAPDVINKEDIEMLPFLLEVCRRGEVVGGQAGNVTARLVRKEEPPEAALAPISGEFAIGLENDTYPLQHLLGAQIQVGPSRTIIERARLRNFERVGAEYAALSPGESIQVAFDTDGPVRQIFHRFYKGEPLGPLIEA
jgi:hypothetical protein